MHIKCNSCNSKIHVSEANEYVCPSCGEKTLARIGAVFSNIYPVWVYNALKLVSSLLLVVMFLINLIATIPILLLLITSAYCVLSFIEFLHTGAARTRLGIFYRHQNPIVVNIFAILMLSLAGITAFLASG